MSIKYHLPEVKVFKRVPPVSATVVCVAKTMDKANKEQLEVVQRLLDACASKKPDSGSNQSQA